MIPGIVSGGRSAAAIRDPDFSAVKILLPFDGSHGGTTFTDIKGHTFTPNSGADLSSAQAKWGATSGRLDSTRFIASAATLDQGLVGQWCVEAWVYLNNITGLKNLFSTYENGNALRAYFYINGSAILSNIPGLNSASGAVAALTWHHVAITRDAANTVRSFVDGVLKSTVLNFTGNQSYPIGWRMGFDPNVTGTSLGGYMDDFRLTVGAARYTAPFTPPLAAFPTS